MVRESKVEVRRDRILEKNLRDNQHDLVSNQVRSQDSLPKFLA